MLLSGHAALLESGISWALNKYPCKERVEHAIAGPCFEGFA